MIFLTSSLSLTACHDFVHTGVGYSESRNYYKPRKSSFNRTPSGPEFDYDVCLKLQESERQTNQIGLSIYNMDRCNEILQNPPRSRR